MRVLVTGANGLLGAHVVSALLDCGFVVRAMIRKGSNLKALEGLKCEYFEGEVTNRHDVEKAIGTCNYVVHVAAKTSQSPSGLKAFQKINIDSVDYVIDACKKYAIKRLVYVSTANCFGNGTIESPGKEQMPFLPWLKSSGYAYSKYLAQQKVLESVREHRLKAVVVNPTFIIGEKDVKPSSGQIFSHVLGKRVVFYPPGGKNFVDAEAAAKAVVNSLGNGRIGECYLLAGQNHTYLNFFKMVKKQESQKAIFIPLPGWFLLLAGGVGSCIERVLGSPVVLTKTNARMLCLGNYFTAEKAMRELGLEQVATESSVKKAILWFKQNKYFSSH